MTTDATITWPMLSRILARRLNWSRVKTSRRFIDRIISRVKEQKKALYLSAKPALSSEPISWYDRGGFSLATLTNLKKILKKGQKHGTNSKNHRFARHRIRRDRRQDDMRLDRCGVPGDLIHHRPPLRRGRTNISKAGAFVSASNQNSVEKEKMD